MAKNTEATKCECGRYDALNPEQLTEENLASGNYDVFTTGCAATTRNLFAPGHDAKLKSFLILHAANGNEIRRTDDGGVRTTAEALKHAERYEFAHMVAAGIAKAEAKAKAKAEREAARAAKKAAKGKPAERKLAESAGVVSKPLAEVVAEEEAKHLAEVAASRPEPEWDDEPKAAPVLEDEAAMNTAAREERERDLVAAKVGRWEYQGFVTEENGFRYRNKGGNLITAPAGTYKLV